MHNNADGVYAVILAGGKGKRLRPLSTDAKPKPFLSITRDRKTMLRRTVDRVREIVPSRNVYVVANSLHSSLLKKDLPRVYWKNLVLEPVSRNTAPAIALTAGILEKKYGDAVMIVLPADHYIEDEKRFLAFVKKGVRFVKRGEGSIVCLGVEPDFPATGFGYIKTGRSKKGLKEKGVCEVDKFVEKPDLKTAKRYLKDKRYLWNVGTYIFKASAILRLIEEFVPEITRLLISPRPSKKEYGRMPEISIDYAVMERARSIYCIPGSYGWQDVGSFENLIDILRRESREFVLKEGKVLKIL
ncbi:MAG: mannose-1-phosphate guanylyltransferase [Candidatus Omnitrophota bacterium]|jgi:mannose-1-phosphate guanylyltransferase